MHRFRDGTIEWADETRETDRTALGLIPVLPLEGDDESGLPTSEIDAVAFDQAWRLVRNDD